MKIGKAVFTPSSLYSQNILARVYKAVCQRTSSQGRLHSSPALASNVPLTQLSYFKPCSFHLFCSLRCGCRSLVATWSELPYFICYVVTSRIHTAITSPATYCLARLLNRSGFGGVIFFVLPTLLVPHL